MALHNQISDANKVQTVGRVTRYTATPVTWSGGDNVTRTLAWTITRISSMAYQHIALTREAAEAGAAELTRQLTRRYEAWTHELDESTNPPTPVISRGYTIDCTSTVTPSQASGDAWIVDVGIEDTDTVITTDEPTADNIAELFALAGQREAEETGAANITVSSDTYWDSVTGIINVFWQASNIETFDPALIVVERKQGDNWVAADVLSGSLGAGGCQIASGQNLGFRANYNNGEVISNYYVTNDEPMPAITLLDGEYNYANASTSGAIPISVRFTASGEPRALAGITNVGRWEITVTGATSNRSYLDRARPRSITDDGNGNYTMGLWTDWWPTASAVAENLVVRAVYLGGNADVMSVASTATMTLRYFTAIESATMLSYTPVQTRIRLRVRTDMQEYNIARATWAVAVTLTNYEFSGAWHDYPVNGATVERVEQLDSSDALSVVVKFAYPYWDTNDGTVAIDALTATDAQTGEVFSLINKPHRVSLGKSSPIWITSAVANDEEATTSRINYNFVRASGSFVPTGATVRAWNTRGDLLWTTLSPTDSGQGVDSEPYWLAFASAAYAQYLEISATSSGMSYKSEYLPPNADGFLRVVDVRWDSETRYATVIFDHQITGYDASLIHVADPVRGVEYSASVTGDQAVCYVEEGVTSADFQVVYTLADTSGYYRSNAMSAATA